MAFLGKTLKIEGSTDSNVGKGFERLNRRNLETLDTFKNQIQRIKYVIL
jgi:hypothetical protein